MYPSHLALHHYQGFNCPSTPHCLPRGAGADLLHEHGNLVRVSCLLGIDHQRVLFNRRFEACPVVAENSISHVRAAVGLPVRLHTSLLELRADLDPHDHERSTRLVGNFSPAVPDEPRRPGVINDDMVTCFQQLTPALVRDAVGLCPFLQRDALATV